MSASRLELICDVLKEFTPKSDEEIVADLKEYFEQEVDPNETSLKSVKKTISKITQAYDYDAIASELLNKTGVIYSTADVKKLMMMLKIIPY